MPIDPSDPAVQSLMLQTFIKNSRYVEIIVDTAFVLVPMILGGTAAGILGKQAIGLATGIAREISLLKTVTALGTGLGYMGGWIGKKIKDRKSGDEIKPSEEKSIMLPPGKGKPPDGGGGGGGVGPGDWGLQILSTGGNIRVKLIRINERGEPEVLEITQGKGWGDRNRRGD